MKLISTTLFALVLAAGCSKKTDDKPAAKPAETEPAKPEPAKPEPAKPEPAKPEPAPIASLVKGTDDQVKEAAGVIAVDKKQELEYKSPSGEAVSLKVKQTLKKNKFVVELVATVGAKATSLATIETGVEKGDIHEEPIAAVGQATDGTIVFVGGSNKITGKPASSYEVHLYAWDPATKQLTDARKLSWNDVYDSTMEQVK